MAAEQQQTPQVVEEQTTQQQEEKPQKLAPKDAFAAVDGDKDGLISKEEANELVKKLELNIESEVVEKLFEENNAEAKIDFTKFESLLQAEA